MNNVVLNDAMEKMASNKTEFSIHRGQGTFDECPATSIKMRHLHVSVVKICNGN